jgi:hypothetical protein
VQKREKQGQNLEVGPKRPQHGANEGAKGEQTSKTGQKGLHWCENGQTDGKKGPTGCKTLEKGNERRKRARTCENDAKNQKRCKRGPKRAKQRPKQGAQGKNQNNTKMGGQTPEKGYITWQIVRKWSRHLQYRHGRAKLVRTGLKKGETSENRKTRNCRQKRKVDHNGPKHAKNLQVANKTLI